jgi:hypothetical protein
MKAWFGCTSLDWEKHREEYMNIRKELIDAGCILLFDWIPETDKYIQAHGHPERERDIQGIFKKIVEAINKCDVSIEEYTVPNFSSSHQISLSLARQKPTLVLKQKNPNHGWNNSYIDAVSSPLLIVREYKGEEYKDIIKEFLGEFKNGYGQERYNFVLDRREKYYLDWASEKYSKSRSELLRDLIEKQMSEDIDFRENIKGS